jgi:hypothetical protein
MSLPAKSFERVHYEYRPAKQVERRMLLDAFQQLMAIGFPIHEYQYTGMGSVYFVDFVMFHRYLGISKMLNVEVDLEIEKRVKFNCPFNLIKIRMGDIADQIPRLSQDIRHVLWLDYDYPLTDEILDALLMASKCLPRGSILLLTVDVEPPGEKGEGPLEWMKYYQQEAHRYLPPRAKFGDFAKSKIPAINRTIIDNVIRDGIAGRIDMRFHPLFNFLYADGHQMLSIGGMICGDEEERRLKTLDRKRLPFIRESLIGNHCRIRVPCLTRKERLYLESKMPKPRGWKPKRFELRDEEASDYCDIYRYYPAYTEMFL